MFLGALVLARRAGATLTGGVVVPVAVFVRLLTGGGATLRAARITVGSVARLVTALVAGATRHGGRVAPCGEFGTRGLPGDPRPQLRLTRTSSRCGSTER